ncbi:hypothetical protein BJX64DRAFT_298348 [Aspergillus heterothallicus]
MAHRNRGTLSCEHCRRRRIKCNQLRPRCSQCARAGLICSGYRAPLDLLFRDESTTIARKACKREKNENADPEDHTDIFSVLLPSLNFGTLSTKVEDFAWKYYLDNFNITRNKRDCFPTSSLTSSLTGTASVTSVGLAALALLRHDPHMMHIARKKYSMALRHMKRAVLEPQQLRNGTPAIASFNLAILEMIISDGADEGYSWLKHIHGTSKLMQAMYMPVKGVILTTAGCLQVSFTIALGCLISEQLICPEIVRLVEIYANGSPFIDLFTILSNLVNLYVRKKKGQYGNRNCTDNDLALDGINAGLIEWESRLPPLWKDSSTVGDAPYSERSNWVPRLWGYYRLCRILAHRVTLDTRHTFPDRKKASQQVTDEMCCAIYASVPSILGQCITDTYPDPGLGLTSDVFYLVTILQALIKLTEKDEVIQNWAVRAADELGERFNPLRGFVARHLAHSV